MLSYFTYILQKYYWYVVKNISNNITILSITDDNNNEYLVYEYDKHENENFFYSIIYKRGGK